MNKRSLILAAATLSALLASVPGYAALQQGTRAPQVSTQVALNGQAQNFNLRQALRRGPVVLYFFPKAFTPGCSAEAAAFAHSIAEYRAAGAQVIGLSGDNLEDLKKFSQKECAGAFPVGIASPGTIRAYDVALQRNGQPTGLSDRTSYVIGRDGRIVMVHSDLNYADHVTRTLAAVRALPRG